MSKHPKKPMNRNWLRRGLSGILALALIIALLPGTVLPAQAAHWAMPYAEKLMEWGVMRGDNGNLALDRAITRAEFVAMMNRAYGYKRLGGMPFPDVSTRDWYYQDINIAYNMGYFKGASGYALPKANLTREQAAVLLTRNMMLQENVGEGLQFSDSRALSEWSRGLVGAAADMGIIGGYSDGSFKPQQNITRGEVASMLVKAIGTMIKTPGEHTLGDVYGNVTVNTAGVKLQNGTIAGNLYLTGGIDLGDVLLENVDVLGEIIVSGGGESHSSESSVTLRNVNADAMTVDSITSQFVTIKAEGITSVGTTTVRTNAYVDDSSLPGYGLNRIVLDGGQLLQLAGNVKEVLNRTPNSSLQVVQGLTNKITMDEYATNSTVLVDGDAQVGELNLDVATRVEGEGDIKNLNVDAAGSTVEQVPDDIDIRPGLTADINGSQMNSSQAAEHGADPRLEAGYPKVKNIAPTSASLVFKTNKPGTVYWAVTAVADGSVSEANLIEPPSYGGNILKSGTVKAAAGKTEYTATPALSGLTQAGSYYVSAVFVDDRGVHSPVKVIAFTTPDGTVPAFNGNPYISRNTTAVAQVTGMPNKSCQVYYALLPKGATAPTAAELKANAVRGNLGYGVRDAVKNTNITINVNDRQLDQQTDYVVYLWLTDYDGAKSSRVYSVPFKTPDERDPIIIRTRAGAASETAVEMNVTVDEASTVFWTIIPEGSESEAVFEDRGIDEEFNKDDRALKIKIENGAGKYTKNGKKQISAANANKEVLISQSETRTLDSSKTGTSSYIMYMVAKDPSGNYSEVKKVLVQTKDDTPPQLLRQDFEPAITDGSGRPRADSSIKLVFSENVKGGTTQEDIFLKLYEEVQTAVRQNDLPKEVEARNKLAKALYSYVTLYNEQTGRNERTPAVHECKTVTDPITNTTSIGNVYEGTVTEENWVINYCYAQVKLDGSLTITFPTVKEDDGTIAKTSALKLASGATYHFVLTGIRDVSLEANELVAGGPVTEVSDLMQVRYFTTKFGSVKLDQEDDLSLGDKYLNGTTETPFPSDENNDPSRIDYHFSVEPETVQGMAADWLSDILIGSDTSMTFTLYTRQSNAGVWTKVGTTDLSVPAGSRWVYRSLAWYFPTLKTEPPAFTAVKDMAPYAEYAIHVDELGSETEFKKWSGPVTMMVYVMAGKQRELAQQTAARSGNAGQYENWVTTHSTDIQAIGYDVRHTAIDHLEMENPFPYQLAPKIRTDNSFPTVDAYDTSADITLNIDSTGWVHWMLIPLSGLAGTGDDGKAVDYTGTLTEEKVSKAASYVPANAIKTKNTATAPEDNSVTNPALGKVPIMFEDKAWDSVSANDPDDSRLKELRVTNPTQRQIIRQEVVPWRGVQYGRAQAVGTTRDLLTSLDIGTINLENLEPNTVYVLVMLTQNESGIYDDSAYCYRFTTERASRPYFDLSGQGSIVTADAGTRGQIDVQFIVARENEERGRFREPFNGFAETGSNWQAAATGTHPDGYSFTPPSGVTTANMTALDAMVTKCYQRKGNDMEYVGSVFDVFATNSARDEFAGEITSRMGNDAFTIWSTASRGSAYTISGRSNQFNCEKRQGPRATRSDPGTDMNPVFSYTFIAVAQSTDGKGSQVSFRAVYSLSVSDNTPPKVQSRGWYTWDADDNGNVTTGSFYLQFTEPLYAFKDGLRHPLDDCSLDTVTNQGHPAPAKAGDWVSVVQLVSAQQAASSPFAVAASTTYPAPTTPPNPAATPKHPAASTTATSLSLIEFKIRDGQRLVPGRTYELSMSAYEIADMVGNGGGTGQRYLVVKVQVPRDGSDPIIRTNWD